MSILVAQAAASPILLSRGQRVMRDQMERKLSSHDQAIAGLIDAIRQLMNPPVPARRGTGFTADIDSEPRNMK